MSNVITAEWLASVGWKPHNEMYCRHGSIIRIWKTDSWRASAIQDNIAEHLTRERVLALNAFLNDDHWSPMPWMKPGWIWSNDGVIWTLSNMSPISNSQNDPQYGTAHSINITADTAGICGLVFEPPPFTGWKESVRCHGFPDSDARFLAWQARFPREVEP